MARTAKIAVSVDVEVLGALEALRARTGETRSAAVVRAIRALTHSAEHQGKVEEYRQTYLEHPETPAELERVRDTARRVLRGLPWDEDVAGE